MPKLPSGTVTFLFTDIEASTRLLRQLGERYSELLADHRRLLRESFRTNHGHEVDTQGDAFFVVFARVRDAVSAAVAAQRALTRHEWPEGKRPRVRMGLHTGESSLWEGGYLGLAVHRAARICAAGHGDQILLSDATRAVLKGDELDLADATFRDLGEHELKDFDTPERIYQLVVADVPCDVSPPRSIDKQPLKATPFAGQEEELAAAARAVVGGVPTRVASWWRRARSGRVGDLAVWLRLVSEALWESTRSPLGIVTLALLVAGAVVVTPWIALGIGAFYAVKISAAFRAARFYHGPEGVGFAVHLLAKIPRDDTLKADLNALSAALVRGARIAEDARQFLGEIDRRGLGDRLSRLREAYVSEDDLRRADLLTSQLGALEELDRTRRALAREAALLESHLEALRERLFRSRTSGEVPEELAADVSTFSSRMQALEGSVDEAYRRAKALGLSAALHAKRPRISVRH